MNKTKKHVGSKFDDFLEEEERFEETTAIAAKRVFVYQLEKEMKKQQLDKSKLALKLHTSRSAVDRILDPETPSTLKTFAKTARVLGKQLRISLA